MDDEIRTLAIDHSPDLMTQLTESKPETLGEPFKQHAGVREKVVPGLWGKVVLTLSRHQDPRYQLQGSRSDKDQHPLSS